MTKTIYVVVGFDGYYPPPDGTVEAHTTREAAERVAEALQSASHPDDPALPERLRGYRPRLYEAYQVAEVPLYREGD